MKKKGYHFVKRLVDLVVSASGLVILFPVFVILSVIIVIDDRGNPFFNHMRMGKNGKKFRLYKFRSLKKNANDLSTYLTPQQLEQFHKEFKIENDVRATRFGLWLRKSSLDELPQLLNILHGDMSLVGPRPIIEEELEMYGEDVAKLLSVKPGLTGYWQAYARNNATYESGERQAMEMYYVENESLWLDIKILFKTVEAVIKRTGVK